MILHPWHEVPLGQLSPSICWAFIEISRRSRAKYEIDKQSGLLKLDRVLHSSVTYPTNYGFFPQTLHEDGDPLDVLVLSQVEISPYCLVEVKVIGVMSMIDQGLPDDKIIAVAVTDPSVNFIDDITAIPEYLEKEIINFFVTYNILENKQVTAERFQNKDVALKIVSASIENYKKKYSGKWKSIVEVE
jgi:inorganic pyrophosphatase